MNFLFVNHYANAPVGGNNPYRTYFMARELVKLGHEVTILAAAHSHLRTVQPEQRTSPLQETHNGVRYIFLPNAPVSGSMLSRMRNILGFLWSFWRHWRWIAREVRPDVVVEGTTHILPIFLSRRVARAADARLIYEVRDLWPLSPIEISGKSPRHPAFLAIGAAQRAAIRSADCVISTLRYANRYFEDHIRKPNAYAHIQNGISREYLETIPNEPGPTLRAIEEIKAGHRGLIGYTGGVGLANGLDSLAEAARLLRAQRIAVVIVGKGARLTEFKALAQQPEYANLFVFDAVSKQQVMPITRCFDLGFVGGVYRSYHAYGSSPNKLFDYMYCAVPPLYCISTEDDFLASADCAIIIPRPTGEKIAAEVRAFFDLPEADRSSMGARARDVVLERYEFAHLTRRFLEVVARLDG